MPTKMSQCQNQSNILLTLISVFLFHLILPVISKADAEIIDIDDGAEEGGLSTSTQSDQPSKIFCPFGKKEYSPGDVWYPPVPVKSTINICIHCTCLASGRLNCTQESCPTNCDDSSNVCCKICSAIVPNISVSRDNSMEGEVTLTGSNTDSGNGHGQPIQVDGDGTSSAENMEEDDEIENLSCLHQGKVFTDGEVFTFNVSGLPIASIDQCMQCQCQAGMVLCAMKACSSFKCGLVDFTGVLNVRENTGETCCQKCAAWKTRGGSGHSIPNQKPLNEIFQNRVLSNHIIKDASQQRTTTFGGGEQRHGSRQFQESPPQQPKGISSPPLDSSIVFQDSNNVNDVGNGRPTQKPIDDCISSGIFYLHGSTWHPIVGPFGPMECVSCKCTHGQIECGRLKCPLRRDLPCTKPIKVEGHCCPICTAPNDKTFEQGTSLCVSSKQDITAFKSFGTGQNDTEYIEFAFLRPRKLPGGSDAQVERHEWRLVGPDIEEFTTQYLSLPQFDALRNRQAFTLLGATNEKNVEKFTRREKKLERRCTSRCHFRISSLERSLRLHKLISRAQCLGHERMVHTV